MTDAKYNKIKHLVEVDDDILAVFTITLEKHNRIENLTIAKNANITKEFINYVFDKLQKNLENIRDGTNMDSKMGRLKWTINESDRIRTLTIYEKDRAVIVLIKSNISLSETADNILGYYYERENSPEGLP